MCSRKMADNLIYDNGILLPRDVQIYHFLSGSRSSLLVDDINLSKADEVLLTFFESEMRYTTMSSIQIFNGMLRGQDMPFLVFTSDTEEESDKFLTSLLHPRMSTLTSHNKMNSILLHHLDEYAATTKQMPF